jgi:hypothetical protein
MKERENPGEEYGRRLARLGAQADRYVRLDLWISRLRLVTFMGGALFAATAFGSGPWYFTGIAVFVLAFLCLVIVHEVIHRRKGRVETIMAFYRRGLDRLEGRWAGKGRDGLDLAPDRHAYADDLDLFGRGSLFELLCCARTFEGERVLAQWLCEPAHAGIVAARQEAVEELRENLDLRQDLALFGSDVREGVRSKSLASWASAPRLLTSKPARAAAMALAGLAVGFLVLWILGHGPLPFAAVIAAELVLSGFLSKKIKKIERDVDSARRELAVLAGVLKRLEAERFQSSLLRDLQRELVKEGQEPASKRIARLEQAAGLLSALRNPLFAIVAFVVLWGVHLAYIIEDWRERWGMEAQGWLRAVGELEALCSLAAFAYEHPADPFPEMAAGQGRFEAKDLGHPLLPEKECVRNDLEMNPDRRLLMVSGSNMSGKSTLLRTVGVNAVLAMAGAPVRAAGLVMTPMTVGASIRILDSIQSGASRFYAEITKLKQIRDLADGPMPVLFLLDELLHGTNSHDRRIGAAAVIRALIGAGGVGLVTTHDLALTEIVDEIGVGAANVHFMDEFREGRQVFDYRLRPGVVSDSNALKLMKSIGLEV